MIALPPTMRVFERGWLSSNNILFTGSTNSLVDTGYVKHALQTVQLVEHALRGVPLHQVLNTHLHSDHCGGNAALQERYACQVLVPPGQAQAAREWDQRKLSFVDTHQRCEPFEVNGLIEPDQVLELGGLAWQVIAAPGHDPDAVMLYCTQLGILIAGDVLWQDGFGVIFPELAQASGFTEQAQMLDLIEQIAPRVVVPGHGAVFDDATQALARARGRLQYWREQPDRHAMHAAKVMLSFLMMDLERVALDQLPILMHATPLLRRVSSTLDLSPVELGEQALASLIKAGAVRLEGPWITSA